MQATGFLSLTAAPTPTVAVRNERRRQASAVAPSDLLPDLATQRGFRRKNPEGRGVFCVWVQNFGGGGLIQRHQRV